MRIIIAHNHYQQPGGEDAVAVAEVDMLRKYGHEVLFVEFDNKDFNALPVQAKVQNVLSWDWSSKAYEFIKDHCATFKPDVAHFHNTFYMMTPAVYSACQDSGVPVVQTLHNFRLLCANALLFREGHVCEECVGHSLYRSVVYGCYRDSKVLSWAVARLTQKHRQQKTWHRKVNMFIALTDFARNKFIEGGLPASRIVVKPNALADDPGVRESQGDYFVFAGRLTEEKGIKIVLEAFKHLPAEKLFVLGDGPLREYCHKFIDDNNLKNISLLGHLDKKEYNATFKKAKALIVPSVWYENFPMVILEALAFGIPVIASNLGSMREIVKDQETGLLFKPSDYQDLVEKIKMYNQDPLKATQWGKEARKLFENNFTVSANYERLIHLYDQLRIS